VIGKGVPELLPPTARVHRSFLAAMAEFQAEGRGAADDQTMIGAEIRAYRDRWEDPEVFAEYTAWLRAQAQEESPRPPTHVPSTTLWWVDGDAYLGRLAIRHRLNDNLRELGGHIGHDVRPAGRLRDERSGKLRFWVPTAPVGSAR